MGTGGSAPDLWTTMRIRTRLSLMWLALRVVGFKRIYLTLSQRAKRASARSTATDRSGDVTANETGTAPEPPGEAARRAAALVMQVNRRYSALEARCLVESLTLWWTLDRLGIAADFRLGVSTVVDPLQSHAWVEYEGVPLNDAEDVGRTYQPFDLSEIS